MVGYHWEVRDPSSLVTLFALECLASVMVAMLTVLTFNLMMFLFLWHTVGQKTACRSQLSLLLRHVGPGDQTHVVRLDSKCLGLLGLLPSPIVFETGII